MPTEILFARQSIYGADNSLFAFECLYRGSTLHSKRDDAPQKATLELIDKMCTSLVEDNLLLDKPLFINIDSQLLFDDGFFTLPNSNLYYEILETVPITDEVIHRLQLLVRRGFRFALDDFALEMERVPLLKYMSVIKFDIPLIPLHNLERFLNQQELHNCLLLAEKVETQDTYEKGVSLGFHLFQGYYLEKPKIVSGQQLQANQQAALQLVANLTRSTIEVDEVAELVSRDPVITIKLLKLVNSPLYNLIREVSSIREAVVILGIDVVKQWAIILSLVNSSDCPYELFRQLLTRAKTLSLIGDSKEINVDFAHPKSEFFLAGILSGVDAILGVDLANILKKLALPPHLLEAVVSHKNSLGDLLQKAIGMERFDDSIFEVMDDRQLMLFTRSYRLSLKWADNVLKYLR